MKLTNLFGILTLSLCTFIFSACLDDDEPSDKVSIIEVTVSADVEEVEFIPFLSDRTLFREYLKVKIGNSAEWQRMGFSEIEGFSYEDGCEYKLKVKKTDLANPPMDGGSVRYKLIDVLSKTKVHTDIYMVSRFYVTDRMAIVRGKNLTDAERKEIEEKILATMPGSDTYQMYKFTFNDPEEPKGIVTIYTNDTKAEGIFFREPGLTYNIEIGGDSYTYLFGRAFPKPRVTGIYSAFIENVTDKYKAEYPNLEEAYAQQILSGF